MKKLNKKWQITLCVIALLAIATCMYFSYQMEKDFNLTDFTSYEREAK